MSVFCAGQLEARRAAGPECANDRVILRASTFLHSDVMQPTVSVVIPAYNAAHCIRTALESVLHQTVAPLEILVVDDGSTDETADVVRRMGGIVRLLTQENGGPGAARNHGIREARGEWIALLDADDTWLPNRLERQLDHLADDVILVCSQSVDDVTQIQETLQISFESLWDNNLVGTSTVLARRSAILEVGGFDTERSLIGVEDYNLWLKLAATGGRMIRLPEELVQYTPAPDNLSSQTSRIVVAEIYSAQNIHELGLVTEQMLERKLAEIYAEYGSSHFHVRELVEARRCFWRSLSHSISIPVLLQWMAAHVPRPLLDVRRRFRSRFGRSVGHMSH